MAGVNKVILVGNVGNDPEIRSLQSGSKVASFSIATSESYTDRNGQKQENTEWHRIEMWDNLAGIAEQYIRKGSSVYVEGKIKSEKYTDKDNIERTSFKIRGLSLQLLGSRQTNSNENEGVNPGYVAPAARPAAVAPAGIPAPPVDMTGGNDDLPF
jgi:single-strand DNA-binding protein